MKTVKGQILIYLVDDDGEHLRLIARALSAEDKKFKFKSFISPEKALKALLSERPDVVISDYIFSPASNGLDFLKGARKKGYTGPFIFLTGQGSEEVAAEALRLGAEDYFTKDIGFAHFIRIAKAIHRAVEHNRKKIKIDQLKQICSQTALALDRLIDQAENLVLLLDEKGRLIKTNKKFVELTGYNLSKINGRPFADFITDNDRAVIRKILSSDKKKGPLKWRLKIAGKNGKTSTIELVSSVIKYSSVEPHYLLTATTSEDQKMSDLQPLWKNRLFENIVDTMEDVVEVVDRDLKIVYCSRNVSVLSRGRLSRESMEGEFIHEIFPFFEEKGVLDEFRRVFRTGNVVVTQESSDYAGEKIVTKTYKFPVKDSEGRVAAVVALIREITEEYSARQRKDQFFQAIHSAEVGIAINDLKEGYIYANRKYAEIHGYPSPRDILARKWQDLLTEEFNKKKSEEIYRSLKITRQWTGEADILCEDGHAFPVYMSLGALGPEDEEYDGFITIIQDISHEKGMAEELARKNIELEKLNKELEYFISMTSHELRSPLANIEGFARLLEEKFEVLPKDDKKDFIHRIANNADRLRLLIEDLLTFSREKKRESEYEEVDLKSLMKEVLGHLGKQIDAESACVTTEFEVKSFDADRRKLFQIMKNLIENAVTYSREGVKPAIKVKVTADEKDGFLIAVSDNGRGIPEFEKQTIFEIFRRGSSSRGKPGTGVGMALVRENVAKMGGRVWLDSVPGTGSTFYFTLPGR